MRKRMTPTTDLSTESTLQSPPDHPQFEAPITTIAESVESEMGAPQDSNRLDTSLEKPENTDKLSLTEDPNFVESDGTAEEVNVESLAGMLDDLYNHHV